MLRVPTIHRNGTSAADLRAAYLTAYEALLPALEALQATAPNARDYYMQPGLAFRDAAEQHTLRLRAITEAREELEQLIIAIDNQTAVR